MCAFSAVVTFANNSLNWVIATNGEIAGEKRADRDYVFSTGSGSRAKADARGDGEVPFLAGNRFWLRLL